jgi:hypothetical protein
VKSTWFFPSTYSNHYLYFLFNFFFWSISF